MKPAAFTPASSADHAVPPWLNSRRALAFVACYFIAQALLRVLISNSAELDESEQLLYGQVWRWGYASEPPLYTWLQMLVFNFVGTNVLALAFLKNLLLFSAFLFTFLAAKEIAGDEHVAVVAMLSLFLFPQITWESQRDLTHSVLATAAAAATFWMAIRVIKFETPAAYAGLGITVGLGVLSKGSYALWALSLALAGCLVPRFRSALLNPRLFLGVACFLLITAPYIRWVVSSPETVMQRPQTILHGSGGRHLSAWLLGFWSIAKCVAMLGGAIVVAYGVLFRGSFHFTDNDRIRDFKRLIQRMLMTVLALAALVVLFTGLELKDRWFQPVVFLIAIYAALLVRDRWVPLIERRFIRLIGVIAAVVLLLLPGIPLAAGLTKRPTRLNAPYAALVHQLKERVSSPAVIVAESRLVAGNMRLFFNDTLVLAPEFYSIEPLSGRTWICVWDATKRPGIPPALADLLAKKRGAGSTKAVPAYVEAPSKYAQRKPMKLGYFTLPALP